MEVPEGRNPGDKIRIPCFWIIFTAFPNQTGQLMYPTVTVIGLGQYTFGSGYGTVSIICNKISM